MKQAARPPRAPNTEASEPPGRTAKETEPSWECLGDPPAEGHRGTAVLPQEMCHWSPASTVDSRLQVFQVSRSRGCALLNGAVLLGLSPTGGVHAGRASAAEDTE